MKADPQTEAAVMEMLDQVGQAFIEPDIDLLLAQLAPESDALMFGTGIDERRLG